MEKSYWGETKALAANIRREWGVISAAMEIVGSLNENQILNTLFPASILVTLIALMNRALKEMKKYSITFLEFQPFLRCFFGLSYYSCSVTDVEHHSDAYPLVTNEVRKLTGNTFRKKIRRLKDCLKAFEGAEMKVVVADSLNFKQIYKRDFHMEKFLRDAGEHASQLGFVEGVSLSNEYVYIHFLTSSSRVLFIGNGASN